MKNPTTTYRVTKYDPALRDENGAYHGGEWTSMADVGSVRDGRLVTMEQYLAIEDAYVGAVAAFMEVASVSEVVASSIMVLDSEWMKSNHFGLREGASLSGEGLWQTVRAFLREKAWSKLAGARGFLIHIGEDSYMFIALPTGVAPPGGLPHMFVEEMEGFELYDAE